MEKDDIKRLILAPIFLLVGVYSFFYFDPYFGVIMGAIGAGFLSRVIHKGKWNYGF